MYMAYGWPHIIPMESGQCSSSEKIIYLKVINRLLLVVCSSHLELWSSHQHRVRLGKYTRDFESIERDGLNLRAAWSPDAKLIAIITSSFYLHIFKVNITNKRLQIGGKHGPFLATISKILCEEVPFATKSLSLSNIICDNKYLLLGLSDGSLFGISWNGEFIGAFDISASGNNEATLCRTTYIQNGPSDGALGSSSSPFKVSQGTSIIQLEFCFQLKLLFVLYSGGDLILCSTSQKGLKLKEADCIKIERKISYGDVVCASFSTERKILALGTRRGMVELYSLAECGSLIRTISLHDWGYSSDDTGPVNCIAWTPDHSAFSVGWKLRGLTVWSISGCRLMSTICQIGLPTSPADKSSEYIKHEPLVGGTSMVQWDEYGYKLYAVEEGTSVRVLAFSFGKCCVNKNIFGSANAHQLLYGDDRLLIVQSEDPDKVKILHLNLPVTYLSQNWPVLHVSASKDGMYIAVAGLRGILIYGIRLKKWRFFGDITQEQKIQCKGLLWLGKIIIICNYNESSDSYELLFYPRYHLDKSSRLCRKPLPARPIVMDVYEDYILVTFPRFNVHVFRATIHGNLTPLSNPRFQLCTVRELSILTAKSSPAAMIFVPDQLPRDVTQNNVESTPCFSSREPTRCLILRSNEELTLLDLVDGREREITESVELFWVTCGQLGEKTNLIEEISWLDYGSEGMRVWYPSPGADPFEQEDFLQLDPELEFDREVYPLGLLPHAGVVVGVSQRMSFVACTEFPCFEPFAQVQTVLHCLLRHLLQRNKNEEALRLARLSAEKTHFVHSLEWLLFTVFDSEISRQNAKKNQLSMSKDDYNSSLLEKACDLIKNFHQYHDVVVSVARKTDGRHWVDLFSTAGRSTELFEECILRRWYRTAACYILVIAKLEGVAVSQYCALKLLQATLDESLYELAGDLVRFLLRSEKDYDSISTDDRTSPKFLGYFFFGWNHGNSSSDFKRASLNEKNPHVTSVMNILESHASYLMSEKELSKLVAFVKGTHFDLVDYLQREKFGSARLESFSSGLNLIQKKLEMETLQSRMDAEFLLAHMCSVKFKEWIVVLATLLRRPEVLIHLFQGDLRLWTVYKATLLETNSEYGDLLDELEGRLSAPQLIDDHHR